MANTEKQFTDRLTQYDLSRSFWDFTFENPDQVKTTHIAIFFFAVEHCNRLGWKEKFGLPTSMVKEAIGLKSYNTYKKHFDDLVEWGFFIVKEYSKNQHSSNIIALSKNDKAHNKALDRANSRRPIKKDESTSESTIQSTGESTGSINKPVTIEPTTTEAAAENEVNVYANIEGFKNNFLKDSFAVGLICQKGIRWENVPGWLEAFNRRLIFTSDTLKSEKDYRSHFANWVVKIPNYRTIDPGEYSPMKDSEIKNNPPQPGQRLKTAQEILAAREKR